MAEIERRLLALESGVSILVEGEAGGSAADVTILGAGLSFGLTIGEAHALTRAVADVCQPFKTGDRVRVHCADGQIRIGRLTAGPSGAALRWEIALDLVGWSVALESDLERLP